MPFHDAFLNSYTQMKATLQRQQQIDLQKQLDMANIEHVKLTGDLLKRHATLEEKRQAIEDMKTQQEAIASGASFAPAGGAPAAGVGGDTESDASPAPNPSPMAAAPTASAAPAPAMAPGAGPAAPAPNVIQTPFGSMTAPGPAQISDIAANRARLIGQATKEGEVAGDTLPRDLTITVQGMKPVTIPAGTPRNMIPGMISAGAGITEAKIHAAASPTALMLGLSGGIDGGGTAPAGPGPAASGAVPPGGGPPAPVSPRDEAIAKVPPFFRSTVQAVLDGNKDPTSVGKGIAGQMILKYAHQIDPTFNEGTYKQRFTLQKSFTSGEESNNIKAVNTAAAHLATVSEAADALHNGNIQLFNQLKNSFETAAGSPEVNDYNLASHVAAQEVAKVIHGAGVVPEGQGEKVDKTAAAVNSPAQLNGMFAMAAHLMEGRMSAIQNKYVTGMGKQPDQPLFMPEALASIKSLKQKAAGGQAGSIGRFQRVE